MKRLKIVSVNCKYVCFFEYYLYRKLHTYLLYSYMYWIHYRWPHTIYGKISTGETFMVFSFSFNYETFLHTVALLICSISLQKHYNEIFTANDHFPLKFVKVSHHGCFSMHGTITQYKTIMMVEDFVRLANSQQSSEVLFTYNFYPQLICLMFLLAKFCTEWYLQYYMHCNVVAA